MIGQRIREVRHTQQRSLADVAAKARISVATLSRIETDKQSVDLALFVVLAKVLKTPPRELLEPNGELDAEDDSDFLARRIATLETRRRVELWRRLAEERKAQEQRNRKAATRNVAQHVDEVLAHLDVLREELKAVRLRVKKKKK